MVLPSSWGCSSPIGYGATGTDNHPDENLHAPDTCKSKDDGYSLYFQTEVSDFHETYIHSLEGGLVFRKDYLFPSPTSLLVAPTRFELAFPV